jgi:hypothetical protein
VQPPAPADQIRFLTNLQRLLAEGLFTATYKYALIAALADLSSNWVMIGATSCPYPPLASLRSSLSTIGGTPSLMQLQRASAFSARTRDNRRR